ncbi:MAG: hypothetical protein ABW003_09740 [Microvirga sp.]
MLLLVMEHVAALAERRQVRTRAIRPIVIQVSRGQNHVGLPNEQQQILDNLPRAQSMPGSIPPCSDGVVPPSAITQMRDPLQMRAFTALTTAGRALEADHSR